MNARQQMTSAEQAKPPNAITELRADLDRMTDQFRFALPSHIPVDRFMRVIMTAVQNNPNLLRCTKQSFFNACMRAAQDGLLPDGREAAIVPYGENEDGAAKRDMAQYLPMIAGIRKKVRNAGVLSDWNVQVVQDGDEFDYQLGDNPFIHHKPAARGGRTRPVLFAYSIATFPDGTKSREVMNIDQISDIRSKAKAKKGPWGDPIFFPEMCRKTVARLHSKQLPMSTDLDTLFRRDDDMFQPSLPGRERARELPRPTSVADALDRFAADDPRPGTSLPRPAEPAGTQRPPAEPAGTETETRRPAAEQGEPADDAGDGAGSQEEAQQAASPDAPAGETDQPSDDGPLWDAYQLGRQARQEGKSRRAVPEEYRDASRSKEAVAWHRGWNGEAFSQ